MKNKFKYIIWLVVTFIASIIAIPCMIIECISGYLAKQMFNVIECFRAYFNLKEFKFINEYYNDEDDD